jgi:hypothetical protein
MGQLKDTLYVIKRERFSFSILRKISNCDISQITTSQHNFEVSYSITFPDGFDASNLLYNDNNEFDQFVLLKNGEYFCSPTDTGYSREGVGYQFQCFYNRIKNTIQVSDSYRKLEDDEKTDFMKLLASSRINDLT